MILISLTGFINRLGRPFLIYGQTDQPRLGYHDLLCGFPTIFRRKERDVRLPQARVAPISEAPAIPRWSIRANPIDSLTVLPAGRHQAHQELLCRTPRAHIFVPFIFLPTNRVGLDRGHILEPSLRGNCRKMAGRTIGRDAGKGFPQDGHGLEIRPSTKPATGLQRLMHSCLFSLTSQSDVDRQPKIWQERGRVSDSMMLPGLSANWLAGSMK